MDSFGKFPFVLSALFLIGLFFIAAGIRIIRERKYLAVGRYTFPDKLPPPQVVKGKIAVYQGISYILLGLVLVIFAIMIFLAK